MAEEQAPDAEEQKDPVETEQADVQADLTKLIDEVRVMATQALNECKELRAIVTEEALDEAADDAVDDDIDPEDLQIEDLLA